MRTNRLVLATGEHLRVTDRGDNPHGSNDWDVMLMTEYKDLATMEANQAKADTLSASLVGGDQKMEQGYRDRTSIRDLVGTRLAREVVLQSRQ